MNLRQDANQIIKESINRVLPDEAVKRALIESDLFGKRTAESILSPWARRHGRWRPRR